MAIFNFSPDNYREWILDFHFAGFDLQKSKSCSGLMAAKIMN